MEGYAAGELAASADLAGPLAGMLAALGRGGRGGRGGRRWRSSSGGSWRGSGSWLAVLQHALDVRAAAEVRLAQVTGVDGVARPRAGRGARTIVTGWARCGAAVGYRARVKGVRALFPADAALNLPRRRYSWGLQQLAVLFTQAGRMGRPGSSCGGDRDQHRQAAAGADHRRGRRGRGGVRGCPARGAGRAAGAVAGCQGGGDAAAALRRRSAKSPGQRVQNFGKRRETGEKSHKRMAQAGCVFDVAVPDQPRTPEQILARPPARNPRRRPGRRASGIPPISPGAAETIAVLFDQAGRRDPARARTWIALADGDNHQIGQIQDQAAARSAAVTILIDFVHVQEYL